MDTQDVDTKRIIKDCIQEVYGVCDVDKFIKNHPKIYTLIQMIITNIFVDIESKQLIELKEQINKDKQQAVMDSFNTIMMQNMDCFNKFRLHL